jgi:hypothetical protein
MLAANIEDNGCQLVPPAMHELLANGAFAIGDPFRLSFFASCLPASGGPEAFPTFGRMSAGLLGEDF